MRVSRDRWLIAYADMVTLLLACFAALYATAIARAPGPAVLTAAAATPVAAPRATAPAPPASPVDDLTQALAHVLASDATASFELMTDARGLVVSMPEAGAFAVGRAEPSAAASQMLLEIATVLGDVRNAVRVEGHTDDLPIESAAFPSNWELSTARATRVVQFLIERGGLSPERLSAAGYGSFHPRVANDSPAHRARNRRVDLVILTGAAAALEPSAVEGVR
jgi:chemotaxis protein MotB